MISEIRTQGCRPEAPDDVPAEPFHRSFFRVFNITSVALVFWLCFTIVVTSNVKVLAVKSFEDWVMLIAYITRQELCSGLLGLLAVALGSALLPRRLSGRARWATMFVLLVMATAASSLLRIWMSSYPIGPFAEEAMWCADLVVFWTTFGLMAYGLVNSIRSQQDARRRLGQQIAEQSTLSAAALEARLAVLQAQIEPHFLFNTLANVRRLCEVDPQRGRQMLSSLLDYLRAALPAMRRPSGALAEEFELVRAYLSVLQHRMGDRLHFKIELSDHLAQAPIPPLILPTLVENAIRHGLGPLPEGGTITVHAVRDNGHVVVSVADDGAGFHAASGSGVGLANTRARLSALFGNSASLSLRGNEPRGVIAEVRLPYPSPAASHVEATQPAEAAT